jgi:hypothetical protein
MDYTAANNFFGPDYDGAEVELVGTFDVKANAAPVDVTYQFGPDMMSILPTGGYIIKYMKGSYLIMSQVPTFLTIGGESGLRIGWMSSSSRSWSIAPFNIDYKATDENELRKNINPAHGQSIMQLEFTRPHRLQLLPPSQSAGSVKVKIMRYASKCLLHPTEDQLVRENSK